MGRTSCAHSHSSFTDELQLAMSAIVHLLGIANARLSKTSNDQKRAIADFEVLSSVIQDKEDRWLSAGILVYAFHQYTQIDADCLSSDVLETFRPLLGESANKPPQAVQRKRARSTEVNHGAQERPDITLDSSSIQTSSTAINMSSNMDWDVLSLTAPPLEDWAAGDARVPFLNEPVPPSTGSVYGSVDFGALFGLGEAPLDGIRPWSPAPYDEMMVPPPAGSFPANEEGVNVGSHTWDGVTFDLG